MFILNTNHTEKCSLSNLTDLNVILIFSWTIFFYEKLILN